MTDRAPAAVFVSYAREDSDAARRIAEALRSHGFEVWFDQDELRGGEAWDQKLRRQIKECALFVPVVSANTQERREGYFRLEWKLAAERTHLMAEGVPFIAPVVIDETAEANAMVPAEFLRVQWTRLPGARVTPEFAEQVKRLLAPAPSEAARSGTASRSALASVRVGGAEAAPLRKPRGPSWIWPAVAAACVVGIGVAFLFIRKPEPAIAPSNTVAETPPAPATPAISAKSIAVLPFGNLSPDPANAFFADGVHEDVLTNLTLIRELTVVPRITAMHYRDTKKTLREIGEELRVAYILAGSIRRDGQAVRFTGQLIDARTGAEVWTKRYNHELTNVFAIQATLATDIAGELRATLSPQEQQLIARRPTENVEAYDAYLKARANRYSTTGFSLRQLLLDNEAMSERAVRLDPQFAEAWAELAVARSGIFHYGFDQSPASLAKITSAIETAHRLAPDAPDVIRARADYFYRCFRDYPRATEQLERVARLQPNDPEVYQLIGVVQRRQGRWQDALVSTRKAVEVDPRYAIGWLNVRHSCAFGRRYEELKSANKRMVDLEPKRRMSAAIDDFCATGSTRELDAWLAQLPTEERDSEFGRTGRRYVAIARGDYAEALRLDASDPPSLAAATLLAAQGDLGAARERAAKRAEDVKRELQVQPANAGLWSMLGQIEALLGHKEEALRCARQAMTLMPESRDAIDGPTFSHDLAVVQAWLGEKEAAIAGLARLLQVPGTQLANNVPMTVHMMRRDPRYSPLWGDPRFEALLNDPKNNAPLY